MRCVYVRQTSEFSPLEYLDAAAQFDAKPANLTCYKHIIHLLDPDEQETAFSVRAVGYEVADPKKNLVNRIAKELILHYVTDGEGFFNGVSVKKGDCFFTLPHKSHSLRTNPNNTLRFYWLSIRLPEDMQLSYFGLDPDQLIFPYSFEQEMKALFEEMLHYDEKGKDAHFFFLGKFYQLVALHKAGVSPEPPREKTTLYGNYVTLAKRLWEEESYRPSVDCVAKTLGFSRKHFSRIFLQQTGILPQQYVLKKKIETARLRLTNGETDLQKLAHELGYGDYPSFSRAFKNESGLSPAAFLASLK